MKILETTIPDLLVFEAEPAADSRGFFARVYDQALLDARGVRFSARENSTSFNVKRGTLRGLHYQLPPGAETKLVRCTRGAIFDVVVDLRPGSPSFRKWYGADLTAANLRSLLVPPGCAHGFITLEDASEVFYQIDAAFAPGLARGARWNDPVFAISWPLKPAVIAERDANYPDFVP
jgi:dTDP-4-dehydrorhamnose 3,5-epimerase